MRTLLLLGVFGGIGHVDVGHDVMPNNKCWTFVKLRVFCSSFVFFVFCFFCFINEATEVRCFGLFLV